MSMKMMILLKSSDGKLFIIDEAVAVQSLTIKRMLEDDYANNEILPLSDVTSKILEIVLEYCKKHVDYDSSSEEDLKKWDADFMKMNEHVLSSVTSAAIYLDIETLLSLTSQTVVNIVTCASNERKRKKHRFLGRTNMLLNKL